MSIEKLTTSEKILYIVKKRGLQKIDLAIGSGQTSQNLYNKLKRNNFSESELDTYAKILGCELKISFIDKETGKEII